MIKRKYEDDYYSYCISTCGETKYEWCASIIFDLVTYDSELDEIFVKNILEVCKSIINRTNYDYIKDPERYVQYIIVCQLLSSMKWIDWGTSIRGAWIAEYNKVNIIAEVPLTEENLRILIDFMEEEDV